MNFTVSLIASPSLAGRARFYALLIRWPRRCGESAERMSLLVYLIILAFSGLFVGALARLALPGRDPMSILQTILLGLAGNFIAGIVVWLVWRHTAPGIVISVACSSAILYFIRRRRGGGLTRPGAPR
jgi:uncharacterized membrane protein YeaQ/YmgE (transglycosylase-associated protein family)